jgi:hypothetical protein
MVAAHNKAQARIDRIETPAPKPNHSLSMMRGGKAGNSWPSCGSAPIDFKLVSASIEAMGFNRRKMEDQRRQTAEKEAVTRRATDAQVLEDAEGLIAAWNERQAKRMPMLFSPTIGAAVRAGYWFLWVRCPACRTINAIDLRTLDRHADRP